MDEQPATSANAIELRIEELSQLFDSLDPFPFREKDLDKDAEEFIVGWARELPTDQQLRIIVHLPESQASTSEAHEIGVALNRYFSHRARVIALDLNELFRIGWRSLIIGLTVLSLCIIAGRSRQPHTTSSWTGHRRELDYFRVGCELDATRNFSVRVVADRASTQSISTAFGGPSRIKAVHDRLSDPADLPK